MCSASSLNSPEGAYWAWTPAPICILSKNRSKYFPGCWVPPVTVTFLCQTYHFIWIDYDQPQLLFHKTNVGLFGSAIPLYIYLCTNTRWCSLATYARCMVLPLQKYLHTSQVVSNSYVFCVLGTEERKRTVTQV